jgi:hypothetical protein
MTNTTAPVTFPVVTENGDTRTSTYANGYFITYRFTVADQAAGYRIERRVVTAEGREGEVEVRLAGSPAWVVTRDAAPEGAAFAVFDTRRRPGRCWLRSPADPSPPGPRPPGRGLSRIPRESTTRQSTPSRSIL